MSCERDRDCAAHGDERGQTLPVIILLLVVLCGFVGLTIDVGYGLLQKRRLQAAVDLGLISAAQEMPNAAAAEDEALEKVRDNFDRVTDQDVEIETSTSCMVAGCDEDDRLTLEASTTTPTFFLKLFGVDEWNVRARGSACGPCDSSPFSYDVVIVLDRSYSMCSGGCESLDAAKEGIRELLTFFDPDTDRLSLAVLGSADTARCDTTPACPSSNANGRPYAHATASPSYSFVRTTPAAAPYCADSANPNDPNSGSNGRFWRTAGDFMDGNAGNHDAWVLVPLEDGTDYKDEDGTINESSEFVDTLDCIKHKYWTPIGPAVYESTEELRLNGRELDDDGNEVFQAIVYLGDGAATAMPVRRNNNGTPTTTASWYTWSSGNRDRPCRDAVEQSERAWETYGIHVYTIGYNLTANGGQGDRCTSNSGSNESPSMYARPTMQEMAQGDGVFFSANDGSVDEVFREIGHAITAGGVRLVE